MLDDKDYRGVIDQLVPHIQFWQVASAPGPRGLPASALAAAIADAGVNSQHWQSFDTIVTAFHDAIDRADKGDRIVVLGSFITVSAILQELTSC